MLLFAFAFCPVQAQPSAALADLAERRSVADAVSWSSFPDEPRTMADDRSGIPAEDETSAPPAIRLSAFWLASADAEAITTGSAVFDGSAAQVFGGLIPVPVPSQPWSLSSAAHSSIAAGSFSADAIVLRHMTISHYGHDYPAYTTAVDLGSPGLRRFVRGASMILVSEALMMGALASLPQSVTKWKGDYIERAGNNLHRAWNEPPVWDEDHWEINYIGHPYAGSLYYNTLRSQGASFTESLLFSAFISTSWEYFFEALAEQPSIQDLFVTPLAGALIGELSHQATLAMKRNGTTTLEKVLIVIINPVHAVLEGL
jgi:hypothetical protein